MKNAMNGWIKNEEACFPFVINVLVNEKKNRKFFINASMNGWIDK